MLMIAATTGFVVASDYEQPFKFNDIENTSTIPPLPNPVMITTLSEGWNMIGYPSQGEINLESLAVIVNETIYNWTEAWQQDIILRFVYTYDRDLQHYIVVDNLLSGYGYWMWAYETCELWSLY